MLKGIRLGTYRSSHSRSTLLVALQPMQPVVVLSSMLLPALLLQPCFQKPAGRLLLLAACRQHRCGVLAWTVLVCRMQQHACTCSCI
jgi:hypothetical protein